MFVARTLILIGAAVVLVGCTSIPDSRVGIGVHGLQFALGALGVISLIIALLAIVVVLTIILAMRSTPRGTGYAEPFPDWLGKRDGAADPDLKELQDYSRSMSWSSNDIGRLRTSIENDAALSPAEKVKRATLLGQHFGEWQREPRADSNAFSQILSDIRDNGSTVFLSAFALAVFITLAVGLSNSSFFSSLAQIDQARGLITFLVAISAVAVILLTAINIFWGAGADFKDRFAAAKDLVTIVTGILGTILGFYFGSFNGEHPLTLSFDSPSNYSLVTSGLKIDVHGTAKGGTAPYHFDLLILGSDGVPVGTGIENKTSDTGSISEQIDAPPNSGAEPKKHTIVLLVRDSRGLQTKASIDIFVGRAQQATPNQPNPASNAGGSSGNSNSGSPPGDPPRQPDKPASDPAPAPTKDKP